jgi:hypothetical protein
MLHDLFLYHSLKFFQLQILLLYVSVYIKILYIFDLFFF